MPPSDLEDFAQKLLTATKGYVARVALALSSRVDALEKREPVPGPQGPKGDDGKSVDVEVIDEIVRKCIDVAIAEIPHPKEIDPEVIKQQIEAAVSVLPKAIDGRDGKDGTSINAGEGPPLYPAQKTGDIYLDVVTGTLYQWG